MAQLGIDLGTANTVVSLGTNHVVLDEPSVMLVRVDRGPQRPVAIGRQARALLGKTPRGLAVIRPLADGVVRDVEQTRTFLGEVVRRVLPHPWRRARVRAALGVPLGATTLERQALMQAADDAGLHRAVLVPEPIAGAIGCGINPFDARAHMVVDIGGGTSEVVAFCYGGILTATTCRVAGDEMIAALSRYLREQHGVVVGDLDVEAMEIAAARGDTASLVLEGRDTMKGQPCMVALSADEVAQALRPVCELIVESLAPCVDELPAQAVADIRREGLIVFGGGSLVPGFDKLLEGAFGFPLRPAEQPLTCVAEGAALAIEHAELLGGYAVA